MATRDGQTPLAPASARPSSTNETTNRGLPEPVMPYACQTCTKRKVRCDKAKPPCASCRKSKLDCNYQAQPAKRRKRKLSSGVEKESVRGHAPIDGNASAAYIDHTSESSGQDTAQAPVFFSLMDKADPNTGKLLAVGGQSRYIDSNLWRNLGEDDMQHIPDEGHGDENEDEGLDTTIEEGHSLDPLSAAILGVQQSLTQYHPTHSDAMKLWNTHVQNVEPLSKVLHIPTTAKMVETVSQQPHTASKSDECLLFAIYHFAIMSMTEDECTQKFGRSRVMLKQRYHFATRQALVNAAFLKTDDVAILQALVLFLMSTRLSYDPNTFWILTGVAVRIGQRIGIHRDGEILGLPPFDVQMRRRLFYQLIPLEGMACHMTGTALSITPDSWDTMRPLNLNDDQIWPGMTEMPAEQKGATEMIFCMGRSYVAKLFIHASKRLRGADFWQDEGNGEVERFIREAEAEVEENYIRYCDIVQPLHFLTSALARSAITALRLRTRLPKFKKQTATVTDSREVIQLAFKILDTDIAACANSSLKRFRWHISTFFVWGTWDSIVFILTSLKNSGHIARAEIDAAWSRMEQIYTNHPELLDPGLVLHLAIGRLLLKAWEASPPSGSLPQPTYITALRALRKPKKKPRDQKHLGDADRVEGQTGTGSLWLEPSPANEMNTLNDGFAYDIDFSMGNDFSLDAVDSADWLFWDQLIQDHQKQS